MPYLSKISLNPLRSGAQRLLNNPHRMHAALLGGLPAQPVHERVLWRPELESHVVHVLVLTQSEPSWESVIDQAGWSATGGEALVRDLAPLLDRIQVGRRFAFRLRANPTVSARRPQKSPGSQGTSVTEAERRRGIRRGHRTASHQLQWFLDRAAGDQASWGFTVGADADPDVGVTRRSRESFARRRGDPPVTLSVATYEGRLIVTDASAMTSVLLNGIGRAKAYGCGLLTLAPAMSGADVVAG